MDRTPPASRRPAAGPDPAHPLPPQPGCLPGRLGTASVPASFADLVKKNILIDRTGTQAEARGLLCAEHTPSRRVQPDGLTPCAAQPSAGIRLRASKSSSLSGPVALTMAALREL